MMTKSADVGYTTDIMEGRVGQTWASQISMFTNGNVFAALYLRELDPDGPRRDFSSMRNYAPWTMNDALEVAIDTPERVRRTEIYIPAAVPWILIAGRNIYSYSKADLDNSG